jgi:DNA-binding transcriptional ArsR family regulator
MASGELFSDSARVVDVETVALLTGKSPETIRDYLQSGRLAGQREGWRWLVRLDDAEELRARLERRGERRGQGPRRRVESERRLLDALGDRPGASVSELAPAIGVARRQALVRLRELERRGLICRSRGEGPDRFRLSVEGEAERRRPITESVLAEALRLEPTAVVGEGVMRAS